MSKLTYSVKLESNRQQVTDAMHFALRRGLEAVGMEAVTLTHRDVYNGGTPVKTGRLKNSIAWAVEDGYGGGSDGKGGEDEPLEDAPRGVLAIGTNVEYAKPIEEGGEGRVARRMLRNALSDISAQRAPKLIKASLEAAKKD